LGKTFTNLTISTTFFFGRSLFTSLGKFNLSPDPRNWGNTTGAEDDDWLHNPVKGKNLDKSGTVFTLRGLANVGCIAILGLGLTALL
jgi:hypothetical protein